MDPRARRWHRVTETERLPDTVTGPNQGPDGREGAGITGRDAPWAAPPRGTGALSPRVTPAARPRPRRARVPARDRPQAGTSACPACPAWGSAVTTAGAAWRPAPCPRGTRPRRQAAAPGVSVRVSLSPPDVDRGPQVWRHVWCPTRERVPPASRGRRPGHRRAPAAPRWGAAPTESRGALRGRREEQKVGRLWRGVQRREQRGRRGGSGREDAGAPETPPAPRRPRLCDPGSPGDGRRLCTPPRSSAVSLLIEEVGTPRRRRPGRGEHRFLCFKLLVCGDLSL